MDFFKRNKKMAPIYVIVFEENIQPTKSEVSDALALFVASGQIANPQKGSRFVYLANVSMSRSGVDGGFLSTVAEEILKYFPELEKYITVSEGSFESDNLDITIGSAETETGYVRVMHIKEM